MGSNQDKLDRIEEIYNRWKNGYLGSNGAMSQIGDVIRHHQVINQGKLIDASTGECIAEFEMATAIVVKN